MQSLKPLCYIINSIRVLYHYTRLTGISKRTHRQFCRWSGHDNQCKLARLCNRIILEIHQSICKVSRVYVKIWIIYDHFINMYSHGLKRQLLTLNSARTFNSFHFDGTWPLKMHVSFFETFHLSTRRVWKYMLYNK